MAKQLARIPIILEPVQDLQMLIDLVNKRIDEVNRAFLDVELTQAKLEGHDTNNPKFFNDLQLQNHRITGVGRSREPQDVVTRRELEELGILGNRGDGVHITGDLVVDGTITVLGGGDGADEVTTNDDVDDAIDEAIEDNVATSVDGDLWVRENAAGINGSTTGTVAMGVDGTGKVRPVELREGQIPVVDMELRTLIEILIEEVRALRNAN